MEVIYLGAGCFWGVEAILGNLEGVLNTQVGYMGGCTDSPTYRDVCTGTTNHAEVVRLEYDRERVSLGELLNYFWRLHDPTQLNRQGVDIGTQYRSAIFYEQEEQKAVAIQSKENFNEKNSFGRNAVTEITKATRFWIAEDYHQNYFKNNPSHPVCHRLRDIL